MARVYVAGPLFTPQDRNVLETLDAALQALGHESFLPHRELTVAPLWNDAEARRSFQFLVEGLESCDAVVALLDGPDADGGTCVELGIAHALRRPVLGLRSDARTANERRGVNLMAFGACQHIETVTAWAPDPLKGILEPFLARVRVLAGTLVRDAVPELLEREGRPLKFREVSPDAYPGVLKRKLVESARRLEEAEWGTEQEEIADVLELLETLVNLRKYDKESLRSIKEGKWRRRGGFERGILLAEEPKLPSA